LPKAFDLLSRRSLKIRFPCVGVYFAILVGEGVSILVGVVFLLLLLLLELKDLRIFPFPLPVGNALGDDHRERDILEGEKFCEAGDVNHRSTAASDSI
jgi:hypothetical protein